MKRNTNTNTNLTLVPADVNKATLMKMKNYGINLNHVKIYF